MAAKCSCGGEETFMDGKNLRRFEGRVLWTLLVLALSVALWPVGQWFYGWINQQVLAAQWRQARIIHPSPKEWRPLPRGGTTQKVGNKKAAQHAKITSRPKAKASPVKTVAYRNLAAPLPVHWPSVRVVCSKIGLDAVVVQGVEPQSLRRGPGHDPRSAAPGEGNCVIAAHRNAYGWWFRHLDKLAPGDPIALETPEARFIYHVVDSYIVDTDNTAALAQNPDSFPPVLTLYSCTLPKSERRLVVVAVLESGAPAS
jgi:LPXTG-site transpeptidase (sortase) family protein